MRVWVTAVAIALMLAGCAEETPEPIEEDFTLEEDLEATETTGVIRGVVVDSAIVPIVGATITISTTGQSTATNEDGAFGFDGLEPGTYFFEVTKLGYAPVQQSADVEAGVAQPPVVRVQMLPDESFVDPYSEMFQYDGFYQCGTSVVVVCAAPGILLGFFGQPDPIGIDSSAVTFYWETTPEFVQTEMVWDSTQTLSPELLMQQEALDTACEGDTLLKNTEGESPLRSRVNRTNLDRTDIGGECGIYYSIFAGGAQGTPAGFSIEQKFTWYVTSFYGFEPDEDWWFIHDGFHPAPV